MREYIKSLNAEQVNKMQKLIRTEIGSEFISNDILIFNSLAYLDLQQFYYENSEDENKKEEPKILLISEVETKIIETFYNKFSKSRMIKRAQFRDVEKFSNREVTEYNNAVVSKRFTPLYEDKEFIGLQHIDSDKIGILKETLWEF